MLYFFQKTINTTNYYSLQAFYYYQINYFTTLNNIKKTIITMSGYDSDEVVHDKPMSEADKQFQRRSRFVNTILERMDLYGTSEDPFNVQQNNSIGNVFDETYQYQHPPNLFENADKQPVGGEVFEDFPEIDKPNPDPFTPDGRKARNDSTHASKPYQEPPAQKVDWSNAKVPSNLQIKGRSLEPKPQGFKIKGRAKLSQKEKQKGQQIKQKQDHQSGTGPDNDEFPERYVETLTKHLEVYLHHNQQREIHQAKASEAMATLVDYVVKLCHKAFHLKKPSNISEHKTYCMYRSNKIKEITKDHRNHYESLKRRVHQEDSWSLLKE